MASTSQVETNTGPLLEEMPLLKELLAEKNKNETNNESPQEEINTNNFTTPTVLKEIIIKDLNGNNHSIYKVK